ncbi:MAG: zinc ribbon domain-containing protein [Desulfobulbus sp.]|jgi:putative FmdB family regulatory protein|nr:MAG: zinc ribbon domain-containing protein [Desulfobulbus sp.]
MPVYEYECPSCDKVFEVQQRMSDEPLKNCPACEGEVRKLVSVSSFQLKGGGWYTDGYSGLSNGKGDSVAKKDSAAPPACPGGGGCKSCPAAAA